MPDRTPADERSGEHEGGPCMRRSQKPDNDDTPSDAAFAETDRIMGSLIREGRAPSYVYAVFDRSGILHVAGGGPDAAGLSAEELQRLRFRIASMSKSFTAAAVLRLADEGLLRLDRAVADIVPEMSHVMRFRDDDPDITVADLLSMRSGLATDDAWADRQESMESAGLRAILRRGIRTVFSPGEEYEYSNLGYAVLGEVIRAITGEKPASYIESRIMRPLGLTDTTYDFRRVPDGLLVAGHHLVPAASGSGHERTGDGPAGATVWADEPFTAPGAFSVIGGAISSLKDVTAWDRWLASAFGDPGHARIHDEVLPANLRRIMQTGHIPIPPVLRSGSSRGRLTRSDRTEISSYGYGLSVEHVPGMGDVIAHSGGYPGYGSHMRWHRRFGLGIVVLANGRYATPGVPAAKALDVLVHEAMSRGRMAATIVRPWTETLEAIRRISEALADAGDAIRAEGDARRICLSTLMGLRDLLSMNVTLDACVEDRAEGLSGLLRVAGAPLRVPTGTPPMSLRADTPAQATWEIPCKLHPLECSIALTPLEPPAVQTLDFRVADAPGTDDVRETRWATLVDLTQPHPADPEGSGGTRTPAAAWTTTDDRIDMGKNDDRKGAE